MLLARASHFSPFKITEEQVRARNPTRFELWRRTASGFHAFRHSAASIVNEQTGNLKLTQKFLGHSTIKMTADVYTHTSVEAEREAAVAVERAIYGDLFPVVPNIENRNNSAAIN
jgi:integrase